MSNPSSSDWGAAFHFLSAHPKTAQLMLETFRDTLDQMGVTPSGNDALTGASAYSLADMARAMGIPEEQLDEAVATPES